MTEQTTTATSTLTRVEWTISGEIGTADYTATRVTTPEGYWAVTVTEAIDSGSTTNFDLGVWETHQVEDASNINLCTRPCCS